MKLRKRIKFQWRAKFHELYSAPHIRFITLLNSLFIISHTKRGLGVNMKFENTKHSNWFENLSGVFVLFLPVDFLGSLLNLCELKMLCSDCVDNILLLTYALNTRYAYRIMEQETQFYWIY